MEKQEESQSDVTHSFQHDDLFYGGQIISHDHIKIVPETHLLENLNEFKTTVPPSFDNMSDILLLFQREMACVTYDEENFSYIGSGNATTCVVVFLCSSNRVTCGHIDSDECEIGAMIELFPEEERAQGIKVHIVGGYQDEQETSYSILRQLFISLQDYKIPIVIKTYCAGTFNTVKVENSPNKPEIYGAVFCLKSKKIFPFSPTFEQSLLCPAYEVRGMRSFGCSDDSLLNIYSTKGIISIEPFETYLAQEDLTRNLYFSDSQILLSISTSPYAEEPDFAKSIRYNLNWLLKQGCNTKNYFDGKPKYFDLKGKELFFDDKKTKSNNNNNSNNTNKK